MTVTRAAIKVTYRAVFKSPLQGPLNRMGLNFPVAMEIEVYPIPDNMWRSRLRGAKGKTTPVDLPASPSHEAAQKSVKEIFKSQESEWRMFADLREKIDGDLLRHGKEYQDGVRVVSPDEIEIRDGKVYLKQPEKAE